MDYHDKKPLLETESFRCWELDTKKEKKEFEKEYCKDSFDVKYGDMEITLTGFNIIKNNTDKKVVFAFKVKPDKIMIYYAPKDINDADKKKQLDILEKIKTMADVFGIELKNMEDTLKNIEMNKHILEKKNGTNKN